MSVVGSHYSMNNNIRGSGLTVQGNKFVNIKYICVDIYNRTALQLKIIFRIESVNLRGQ